MAALAGLVPWALLGIRATWRGGRRGAQAAARSGRGGRSCLPLRLPCALQVGADGTQPSVLSLGPTVRLKADLVIAGDLAQVPLQLLQQLLVSLGLVQGHKGVQGAELRQQQWDALCGGIQFHGAGALHGEGRGRGRGRGGEGDREGSGRGGGGGGEREGRRTGRGAGQGGGGEGEGWEGRGAEGEGTGRGAGEGSGRGGGVGGEGTGRGAGEGEGEGWGGEGSRRGGDGEGSKRGGGDREGRKGVIASQQCTTYTPALACSILWTVHDQQSRLPQLKCHDTSGGQRSHLGRGLIKDGIA